MAHTGKASSPAGPGPAGRIDGVIFDMDGTLVRPLLDFAALRAQLGIPNGDGILEAIAALPPAEQAQANQVLLEHELSAAARAQPNPGAVATVQAIRPAGLKTALLTRNAAPAMAMVLGRLGLEFDLAWSREQGPIKPQPDGIWRACRHLGLSVSRTLCVGDFEYDIQAANAAGAVSVLLAPAGHATFATVPHHLITALPQLLELLGIAAMETA